MTILSTGTLSQIRGMTKFVREGEIIAFGDLLSSHYDIAIKHGLGEPTGKRFSQLLDDAGKLEILLDRIVFRSASQGCRTRGEFRRAREETKLVAEKILGREVEVEV